MAPLGRKTPPTNSDWLWVVEINNTLKLGREIHEDILENLHLFEIIPNLSFHLDRGPVDQLERRLRAATLAE